MPISDPDLWQRVETYPLPFRDETDSGVDPPRRSRCFADNLRSDGEWTDDSAGRIVAEYRRFLYLKALDGGPLTPPEPVDGAWHLHLSMGRDFHEGLRRTIGREIAHATGLTDSESLAAYDRGRSLYRAEFDADPPADIWPDRTRLQHFRIGRGISKLGLVLWGLGCFLNLDTKGPVDFAMLGGGLVLFIGGAAFGGMVEPARVSRCG